MIVNVRKGEPRSGGGQSSSEDFIVAGVSSVKFFGLSTLHGMLNLRSLKVLRWQRFADNRMYVAQTG